MSEDQKFVDVPLPGLNVVADAVAPGPVFEHYGFSWTVSKDTDGDSVMTAHVVRIDPATRRVVAETLVSGVAACPHSVCRLRILVALAFAWAERNGWGVDDDDRSAMVDLLGGELATFLDEV